VNTCFAVGGSPGGPVVASTFNAGSSWTVETFPGLSGAMESVKVVDANNIIAVGKNGNMISSTDGGLNFFAIDDTGFTSERLFDIDCWDISNCVIAVENHVSKQFNSVTATCGNGVQGTEEECDDGNLINGDLCSSTCEIEPGCGDNIIQPGLGETCDDGNTDDADGCNMNCVIEEYTIDWSTGRTTNSKTSIHI